MWYVSVGERCIIILNGRQNELEVNTFVSITVLIAAGYKETNHAMALKKAAWQKLRRQVSILERLE